MEITIGEIIITITAIIILFYYVFKTYKERQMNKNLCITEDDIKQEDEDD